MDGRVGAAPDTRCASVLDIADECQRTSVGSFHIASYGDD